MADAEKELRAESSAVARLMGRVQAEKGFTATLETLRVPVSSQSCWCPSPSRESGPSEGKQA